MLPSARIEISSLGTSRGLTVAEAEVFSPTISVPVAIALFDLGPAAIFDGEEVEGGDGNGTSVPAIEREQATEADPEA